jgi:hypothetical protein
LLRMGAGSVSRRSGRREALFPPSAGKSVARFPTGFFLASLAAISRQDQGLIVHLLNAMLAP